MWAFLKDKIKKKNFLVINVLSHAHDLEPPELEVELREEKTEIKVDIVDRWKNLDISANPTAIYWTFEGIIFPHFFDNAASQPGE